MGVYAEPLERVIEELSKLPGIGPKSAQRIAFFLMNRPEEDVAALARAIFELKAKIRFCSECYNISDGEKCSICMDEKRDPSLICVVEEPRDVVAIERTGNFRGRYHVLGGALSPIDGIGPEELRVSELVERVSTGVTEVIIATNPNSEGDATALYLAKVLKPLGISISRIASGLPVGGDIEYADEVTLGRALGGRVTL
ncbi:MAG: recombination mediator RecR [Actinomycetota bacterium]|nr:recombination mediator RecR [Actinomycetota bacterium]